MIALSTSVLPASLTGAIPPVGGTVSGLAATATGPAGEQVKGEFSETLAGLTLAASPDAMAWCDVVIGKPAKPGRTNMSDVPVPVPTVASSDTGPTILPDPLLPRAKGQDVATDGKDLPADRAADDPATDTVWLPSALLPIDLPVVRTKSPPKFDPTHTPPVAATPSPAAAIPFAMTAPVRTAPPKQGPLAPDILVVDPAGPAQPLETVPAAPDILVADGAPAPSAAPKTPGVPDLRTAKAPKDMQADGMPDAAVPNASARNQKAAAQAAGSGGHSLPAAQTPAADRTRRVPVPGIVPPPVSPVVPPLQTLVVRQTPKEGPPPPLPAHVAAPEIRVGTPDQPIKVAPPTTDPAPVDASGAVPAGPAPVGAGSAETPAGQTGSVAPSVAITPLQAAPDILVVDPAPQPIRFSLAPSAPDILVVDESGAVPPTRLAPVAAAATPPIAPPVAPPVAPTVADAATPVPATPVPAPPRNAMQAPASETTDMAGVTTTIVGKPDLPVRPAAVTAPLASQPHATAPASTTPPAMAPVALPAGQVFAAAIAAVARQARRDEREPGEARAAVAIGATTFDALHANAVAATADVRQAALDLRQDTGLQGMIDHIEMLRDGADANDTRIRLVPDALGAVDVSVRKDGDRVHVHFAAENRASAQLLSDAQPRLADLAEARGVKLGQTSVDTGTDPNRGQTRQQRAEPTRPIRPARATRTDGSAASDSRIA